MRRELGMLLAVLVLGFCLWLSNHHFLYSANVFDLSRRISMLGIFAIGTSFVIISGGIDLSVGATIGLTGVLIARFHHMHTGPFNPVTVGIIVAILVAGLIGLIQGLLITALNLQPFIVTLGGMLTVRGIAQIITHGGTIGLGSSSFINLAENGFFNYKTYPLVPYITLIFLCVAVLSAYVLHFTVFGRYVFAIGGNRGAAEYSGIPVKRIEITTYVISSLSAGIAGICYAAYVSAMTFNVGMSYELYAIAAAVIGGVSLRGGEGSVLGAIIGTCMLKVINNGMNLFQIVYHNAAGRRRTWHLSANWQLFVDGMVILLAVSFDQLAHMYQQRRKIRNATAPPARPSSGNDIATDSASAAAAPVPPS